MNKTTLKSKWYYRLLVVIYIGFFLLTLISTVVVNFNTIGNYQTDFEIKCHKGNKETFFAYQEKNLHLSRYADVIDPENWSSSEDPNELGVMSIATEGCGLSKVSAQSYLNKGENIFTAKLKKVNIMTYNDAILRSIIGVIITALTFEFIKRIFYFIALGSLFPKEDKK